MNTPARGMIGPFKVRPIHSTLRTLIVALLLVSWMVATNHCAFGLMKPAAQHATCPGCKPAKTGGVMECCKTIHGTMAPSMALTKAPAGASGPAQWLVAAGSAPSVRPAPLSVLDHGPPPGASVSILRRSFLSHAPPSAS